jgi:hypothetical protein
MHRDARHPHPGIYPQSCEPQGWSASMVLLLIQALLGLHSLAPLGLLLIDPHLPAWLPDLRLGRARLDLEFQRLGDGETRYRVARRADRIRVLRQPPPEAPDVTLARRAWAALQSVHQ